MMGGSVGQGAADLAVALLAAVADPKAAEARLRELRAVEASIAASRDSLAKAQVELVAQAEQLVSREAANRSVADDVASGRALLRREETAFRAEFQALSAKLAQRATEIADRELDLDTRQARVTELEARAADLHASAAVADAAANAFKTEYEGKLAKIRELVK